MTKIGGIVIGLLIFIGKSTAVRRSRNLDLARNHQLRQFNAGGDASYIPSGSSLVGSGVKVGKQCATPSVGDIENGEFTCVSSGCKLQCRRRYTLGHGRRMYLDCDSSIGVLTYNGSPWDGVLPPCQPHCRKGCPEGSACVAPNKCEKVIQDSLDEYGDYSFGCDTPCQNGGTCIDFIGHCDCPLGYRGTYCEIHVCDVPRNPPAHATIGASNFLEKMVIECETDYKMNTGQLSRTFNCVHRVWVTDDTQENYNDLDVNCYEIKVPDYGRKQ